MTTTAPPPEKFNLSYNNRISLDSIQTKLDGLLHRHVTDELKRLRKDDEETLKKARKQAHDYWQKWLQADALLHDIYKLDNLPGDISLRIKNEVDPESR